MGEEGNRVLEILCMICAVGGARNSKSLEVLWP